ncbi:hypothetical protein KKF32_00920 [Patescibacteria group bacterium]|nr:hypothetical protein [Patescibacteria group bacterium]
MTYQIHDVSEKKIKLGYWLIVNKKKFKAALIILLLLWSVLTVGYGIYGFIAHFVELPKISQDIASMQSGTVDFETFQQKHAPESLKISEPTVIYTGNNRYDVFAQIENPNDDYAVNKIIYQFESGEFTTPTSTIFLFPRQKTFLMSLANFSNRRLSQMNLKIHTLKWQKIKLAANFPKLNFEVSKVDFHQGDSRSWATFSATNETIYNFREVQWQAILYSGQGIIGVNQIRLDDFVGGQTREITISWFERLPRISKVEVLPVVNLGDPGIIYDIPGQANPLIDF